MLRMIELLEIIVGYLCADFIMGIYHWIKDTYFSPFTPIIGQLFIWNSRLHHVRPRYVTEFSDFQLFYSSAKWTLLWMMPLFYLLGTNLFMLTLFSFISLNDVIHKYAHMLDHERPKWISILQNMHILQSYDEHHLHHQLPHDKNYCPITPYMNIILEQICFWRWLEDIIELVFQIKPRDHEVDFIEEDGYPANIKFIPFP